MLAALGEQKVESLVDQLELLRYEDGERFFNNQVPDRDFPLRVLVHGHASWTPNDSIEQKGAWMLGPGSLFGLGAVNDWAHERKIATAWPRVELPKIRCQAMGPVWVLELAPDRFEAAFSGEAGDRVLRWLLRMFPTVVHAPNIVAAMRQSSQFMRVNSVDLYRLLERAPIRTFGHGALAPEYAVASKHPGKQTYEPMWQQQSPMQAGMQDQEGQALLDELALKIDSEAEQKGDDEDDEDDEKKPPAEILDGRAVYFVLRGELELIINEDTVLLPVGAMSEAAMFGGEDDELLAARAPRGDATVVVITEEAIKEMIRTTPGFARTLGPLVRAKRVES